MSENKTGKYFKYAIGEILLVVIGILIALQINNWNEKRKEAELKQNYVVNLINDLQKDTLQLKQRVIVNEAYIKIIDSVQTYISDSQLTYKDLADSLIQRYNIIGLRVTNTYNDNTFKVLVSSGNINIFKHEFIHELMELNRFQLDELKTTEGNRDNYFDGFGNNRTLYMYSNGFLNPELMVSLTSDHDHSAFLKFYINSALIQKHTINRYIEKTNLVISQTERVLNLLNKELE